MGFKLYANLVYGIDIKSGIPGIKDVEDIHNMVAKEHGLNADDDWKKVKELFEALPVDFDVHGEEGEMGLLTVRGISKLEAYRNASQKVTNEDLAVDDIRVAAFKEWCVGAGIDNPEPAWLLVGTTN